MKAIKVSENNFFNMSKCLTSLKRHGAEVIILNGLRWLKEKYIEEGLDHANLPVLTRKYPSKHWKRRCELVCEPKKRPKRILLHEDLAIKIIMDCRTPESCNSWKKAST